VSSGVGCSTSAPHVLAADVGDLDIVEAVTHRLEAWLHAALETGTVELLDAATVDHEGAEVGGHVPDVDERDPGKLAAPPGRQRKSVHDGQDVVQARLPAVEAAVGALVHAIERVGAIWLADDLVKAHLDMIVQIVGIPVDVIELSAHSIHGELVSGYLSPQSEK
jgi:hypothetical protein